jgi:hypothetical protein
LKAHVLGFRLELVGESADPISFDQLFGWLAARRNVEREFNGFNRLVYVGSTEKYHTGLLLTAKTHKRFCELKRTGEALKINVREAEAGASLIDFNFFVLNRETGRGLYQYYHNSCSVPVFGRFCAYELGMFQAFKIVEEIKAMGGKENLSDQQLEQVFERFSGTLDCQLLVRKENFGTLIEQMEKISAIEFSFASIEPEQERWFRRFTGVSKLIKHRVTFNRKVTLEERRRAILSFVNDGEVEEAAVEGVDADGLEKTIALSNNPDSFGHFDFDSIAGDMDFEPEAFQTSKFMQTLLGVAEANVATLEVKAE